MDSEEFASSPRVAGSAPRRREERGVRASPQSRGRRGAGEAGFGEEAQEADAGALLEGADAGLLRDGSRARPHAAVDGDFDPSLRELLKHNIYEVSPRYLLIN